MSHRVLLVLATAPLLLLACAPAPLADTEADAGSEADEMAGVDVPGDTGLETAGIATNGIATNGIATNGIATNGIATNGIATNGIQINGVTLERVSFEGALFGGELLAGVGLEATVFRGVLPDGTALGGDSMLGAHVAGELANGVKKKLRLDQRVQLGGANADVSAYDVTYMTSSGRKHLCGVDADGQPVLAIPVAGAWDYRQGVPGGGGFTPSSGHFTFACRGAAIAKCVELGYKPWRPSGASGGNLEGHLAACTRALRADYCGDGRPYTVDGTTINLYDDAGVQSDAAPWAFEAEWTAAGARFITEGPGRRFALLAGVTPPCLGQLVSQAGGDAAHFSSGTLLMTEFLR